MVITSHDGFELAARLHRAGGDGGAVLLLHQCDREGEATGLEGLGRRLVGLGLHVLELDLRGYGESRDEAFDGKNWKQAQEHFGRDADAAYLTLTTLSGVDRERIGLVGASCGGRLAIELAQHRDSVRAIALLSAGLGRSTGAVLGGARRIPLLCAASQDDPHGMTASSMQAAFETSEHPAGSLILLKGNAHGAPLLAQEPWLEAAIAEWLHERLE